MRRSKQSVKSKVTSQALVRVRGGLEVRTGIRAGIKQKVTENPVGELDSASKDAAK